MFFIFDRAGGGEYILPLVCVVGLACGTLVTGVMASRGRNPFLFRLFWMTLSGFLISAAFLIGTLSHWAFSMVLLLPAALLFFLLRTGRRN